jgi:hypothetical protein
MSVSVRESLSREGQTEMVKFTYGADPEFFLYTPQGVKNSQVVSLPAGSAVPFHSLRVCGGTKDKGEPIDGNIHGQHLWLIDGATCEVNVPPEDLISNLCSSVSYARVLAQEVLALKGFNGVFLSDHAIEAEFTEEQLKDPVLNEIGCSPDKLALLNVDRPPLTAEELGNYRFAGRHVHLGVDPWPELLPKYVAVRLAYILWALNVGNLQRETRRAKFYGLPGLYRETQWGIELRWPGNPWWRSSSAISRFQKSWEGLVRIITEGNRDQIHQLMSWHQSIDWTGAHEDWSSKKGDPQDQQRWWDLVYIAEKAAAVPENPLEIEIDEPPELPRVNVREPRVGAFFQARNPIFQANPGQDLQEVINNIAADPNGFAMNPRVRRGNDRG